MYTNHKYGFSDMSENMNAATISVPAIELCKMTKNTSATPGRGQHDTDPINRVFNAKYPNAAKPVHRVTPWTPPRTRKRPVIAGTAMNSNMMGGWEDDSILEVERNQIKMFGLIN
jgi:hypothetical protein